MTTVTVSSKFQVVIPEDVRSRLKLQPGQKVMVIEKDGVVHMIPLKPVRETRGIARGITAQNVREEQGVLPSTFREFSRRFSPLISAS